VLGGIDEENLMSSKLTTRDYEILQQLLRYKVASREMIHRAPFSKVSMNAVVPPPATAMTADFAHTLAAHRAAAVEHRLKKTTSGFHFE
jgi:hypothetical protein